MAMVRRNSKGETMSSMSMSESCEFTDSERARQKSGESETKLAQALSKSPSNARASDVLRAVVQIGRASPGKVVRKYKVHSAVSACIVLVGLLISMVFFAMHERDFDNNQRRTVRGAAVPYAESMRVNLENNVGVAYALASILGAEERLTNSTWDNFDTVAAGLLSTTRGITNLQLAPCAIVTKISPIAGSEGAIGHNLIQDVTRADDAIKTIEARKLTFVGPLTLVQGGRAIIGRVPVYLNQSGAGDPRCLWNFYGLTPPGNFWGFATMLSMIDDLLAPVRFQELFDNLDIEYQVVAPWGGKDVLVASSPGHATDMTVEEFANSGTSGTWLALALFGRYRESVLEDIPVTFGRDRELNFATWTLRARPRGGWSAYSPRLPLMFVTLCVSLLNGLVGSYISISGRMQLQSWKVAVLSVISAVEAVEEEEETENKGKNVKESVVKVKETVIDTSMQPPVEDDQRTEYSL